MSGQSDDVLVRLVTIDGVIDVEVPDEDERQLASSHFRAVGAYLAGESDDDEQLSRFLGVTVAGYELETDPDKLDALDDSGELDMSELYPSRRADRG